MQAGNCVVLDDAIGTKTVEPLPRVRVELQRP